MLTPISGMLDGGLAEIKAGAKDDPESLKKVAEQFEALLMAQLLKSMRETSSGGWLGTGDDNVRTAGHPSERLQPDRPER